MKFPTISRGSGGGLLVASAYNQTFVTRARNLGGKWQESNAMWRFDPRDEERVRELLREIYGSVDDEPCVLRTVRLTLAGDIDQKDVWCLGRQILRRPGRDAAVRLGSCVVIIGAGGFAASSGSANNPKVGPSTGVVLEVRNVPEPLALIEQAAGVKFASAVELLPVELAQSEPQIAPKPPRIASPLDAFDDEVLKAELEARGWTVTRTTSVELARRSRDDIDSSDIVAADLPAPFRRLDIA